MEEVSFLVDPETEFLASKQESGNEWELFKENVRPLKRGRNASLLNQSLKSHSDPILKKSLLQNRRRLIEAIDEYKGDDPLHPWIECIKWVQESFPTGGECSGLVVIYEQCVRTFWHSDRYKDDLRYLKVWLEYADNCADAEVIFSFLEANQIGQTHSSYYISYALHMESKNKWRKADDVFNLGIARKAQPLHKLEAAYKKFLLHSTNRQKATEKEPIDNNQPVRSFGTILTPGDTRRQGRQKSDMGVGGRSTKLQRVDSNTPFTIYKDTNNRTSGRHQPESLKGDLRSWHTLGTRVERNKENAAVSSKWTSNKIPQRAGFRTQLATTNTLEVFVDEECAELQSTNNSSEHLDASVLQLRRGDSRDLKRETELLKENPLRNFPLNSLPR
ncbi:mitotic spindle checkpoint protein BUBR1 [Cinnamomum micranthum f. kanehirae]|uniref:Mitotic spindle checkpoint protein BUBR1 n=1 Tax=Cinnamomum micranthum f. kanehirae TaxID=337451 RepID=A0A3S3MAA0_9MAGN|nr:mitotic spindle checkpoint protein BUBR1 [Cinnamomum micranthum f. kanehirae]